MTTVRAILPALLLLLASPALAQWSATEAAKLTAPVSSADDDQGRSVAISGPWAAVGAPKDDVTGSNSGAVHIYSRSGSSWNYATTLRPSVPEPGSNFGSSVALAGNLMVIGAPSDDVSGIDSGTAFVFELSGGIWSETTELPAIDGADGERYGTGVGTDGTTILVGAPNIDLNGYDDVGGVYSYILRNGVWTLEAKLMPNSQQDRMDFGTAVDVDGDKLIAAARFATRCYVFEKVNNFWLEVAQVSAPTSAHAGGIGRNCAISGGTVVFGAPSDDLIGGGLGNAGSAYVWVRALDGDWNLEQKLKASNPFLNDQFGRSVGLEGDLIVIGANGVDGAGVDRGSAYVYRRTGTTWTEQDQVFASSGQDQDEFGRSAHLADGLAIVGAPYADGPGGGTPGPGAAYVFELNPPGAVKYCTAGASASGCFAMLSATGTASATAPSGFSVTARGVEGSKDGLFFFGTSGRQANPWGSGTSFQCVVPPVKRGTLQNGSGSTGMCDGKIIEDLNAMWCPSCPKAHRNPGAGAIAQVQLWYRDPLNTSNQTTSLSDALEFGIGP